MRSDDVDERLAILEKRVKDIEGYLSGQPSANQPLPAELRQKQIAQIVILVVLLVGLALATMVTLSKMH